MTDQVARVGPVSSPAPEPERASTSEPPDPEPPRAVPDSEVSPSLHVEDDETSIPRPPSTSTPTRAPVASPPTETRSAPTLSLSSSASRLRGRFARFGTSRAPVNLALEPLLQSLRHHHPKADVSLVQRAYEVAERAHAGQFRRSGDAYITHPLSVTQILAELGMTPVTLAAALLHDTVEDTPYSLDDLRDDFGDEIAALVDGVTKLDKVTFGDAAQAETVRKMVIAMARDIRVLVIKLADRLHNARTWKYVSPESAARKAQETLEIYAPLAHRLGMNTIKWELEDLSFATLYPKMYEEIVDLVAARAPARAEYLAKVRVEVAEELRNANIKATVTGRPKHYYSVYQKMIVRGRDFEDIYDLVAVRVLVETVRDCYSALGALHAQWKPVPGRFKDYIAMPKFNMYQSLHTTVIGPQGKAVEIQIRTHTMHRRAEYGVAAHWKYKASGRSATAGDSQAVNDMAWLRRLLDWQRETADPGEFLDSLRFEIGGGEVYVFTPKGSVVALPVGSTTVDFAYAVHTEVGHHCIGGRINGRLAPLDSVLENGDTVEILTSKADGAGPSRDWLNFVKSARARNKIRQWFTKERREEAIERGKDAIAKYLRKQGLPLQRLMSVQTLTGIASDLRYQDIDSLYAAVGDSHVSAQSVVARLVQTLGGEEGTSEDLAEATIPSRLRHRLRSTDPGVVVSGADDVYIKIAKCCTPVPGDSIMGFITRGNGVSVHRSDCTNADALRRQPDRIIAVQWDPTAASVFLVQLQVEALDRNRLLSDVTRVLSDHHVNILAASVQTTRERVATSRFTFEMGDPSHLDHVMAAVRKIDGVYDVYRITGTRAAHGNHD
ncbi:MAG: GTP pyrophosphokinase [Actinomycetales bacterium]|nr:MAG: GTP pyrophosphokinase [Actinomycetales bacterium]